MNNDIVCNVKNEDTLKLTLELLKIVYEKYLETKEYQSARIVLNAKKNLEYELSILISIPSEGVIN